MKMEGKKGTKSERVRLCVCVCVCVCVALGPLLCMNGSMEKRCFEQQNKLMEARDT